MVVGGRIDAHGGTARREETLQQPADQASSLSRTAQFGATDEEVESTCAVGKVREMMIGMAVRIVFLDECERFAANRSDEQFHPFFGQFLGSQLARVTIGTAPPPRYER